jgi:hypothetical protein
MLLVHDTSHKELKRLPVDNFGHFIAENLGIAAALAAGADLGGQAMILSTRCRCSGSSLRPG